MISGIRKAPPISINSPRETIASPAACQGIKGDQNCSGIVVDHRGIVGTGELAEQLSEVIIALAAFATLEIELQRHRGAHGRDSGFDGSFGKDRTAEVGVQDGASQVEDGTQARTLLHIQQRQRCIHHRNTVVRDNPVSAKAR